MYYHRFNNLGKLLNGDLTKKNGRGILSINLMDIEYNCYLISKVNGKGVYEGKSMEKSLIYEVKCPMSEAIYISKTQHIFRKRMDGHFSDLLRLLNTYKNHIHLLPILNRTLVLLNNVHIYESIWRSN